MENIFKFNEFILENKKMEFTTSRVETIVKQFNTLPFKYRNNKFFKSIIGQLQKNNKLTENQYNHLSFLIRHGQTMYEAGILSTKN